MVVLIEWVQSLPSCLLAMYKAGWGHWDTCVGTWDLGTRGEGRGCLGHGGMGAFRTWGCMGCGNVRARYAGVSNIEDEGGKVRGKCDMSLWKCVIYGQHYIPLSRTIWMFTQNTSLYWSKRTDYHLRILEGVQRQATRFILNCSYKVSERPDYKSRLKLLKLLPLCYWHKFASSISVCISTTILMLMSKPI